MYPGSSLQSAEQPSPGCVLPSSHSSAPPGSLMPSPQDDVQAPCEQSGSFTQKGVQPSPMSLSPSSHCSLPSATPSPQTVGAQGMPGTSHLKPGSSWQSAPQPSAGAGLPSSHSSSPAT